MALTVTDIEGEEQVLEHARSGDSEALAALYERYGAVVYNVACRFVRSSVEAEDVLQDVFVGLPEAMHRFEGRGSFEGWLKRITTRTALTKLRLQERRAEISIEGQPVHSRTADTPSADRIALEDALASLPNTLRLPFVLKVVEGYSHAEVAEMLGIRVGAAKVRVYRARQQLQKYLGTS